MEIELKDYTFQMKLGNKQIEKEKPEIYARLDKLIKGDSNGNNDYKRN